MRRQYIILYLLIVIILIIINKYPNNIIDTFTERKRIAIILRGESFRSGSQNNRNIGSNESYEEQKNACATHNKLAEKIEQLGYTVDLYVNTYNTKYSSDLSLWYGSRLVKCKIHQTHMESQVALIKDSVEMLSELIHTYDTVLIIRIDLFLKDKFINDYSPDVPTIQFVCVLWIANSKSSKGNPNVNDVIFHFPKKYFPVLDILYDSIKYGPRHHDILDNTNLKYNKDYTFLTQSFHDSDSQKDFNPYYKMIGRPESTIWHDEGKVYPRDW